MRLKGKIQALETLPEYNIRLRPIWGFDIKGILIDQTQFFHYHLVSRFFQLIQRP